MANVATQRTSPDMQPSPQLVAPSVDAREFSRWLWLWLPAGVIAIIVIAPLVDREFYARWIDVKEGAIEWATALVLVVAVWAGLGCLRRRRALPTRWVRGWILAVTLGAFYFGGEEISWGQQIFQWESPEVFKDLNRQNETNLHNMMGWFNEKPRGMVELWLLVGGVIMNLRRRNSTGRSGDWRTYFWPTWICFPVAVIALSLRIPDRLEKYAGVDATDTVFAHLFEVRLSEPQELLFGYFMMLFLLSCRARLARADPEPVAENVPVAG